MTFTINNNPIELVYSFRSNMYFERLTGKSVDLQNLKGDDILYLFYSIVVASLQKERKEICSYLDFLDAIDEAGGEKCLYEFANWYVDVLKAQYDLFGDDEDEKQEKSKKAKGKKN